MNLFSINWLAVLSCVIISMISGSIWYNPKTFFPVWWRAIHKNEDEKPGMSNMGVTWGLTVLAAAVQGLAMGIAVNFVASIFGYMNIRLGISTGVLLWMGFIAPTYLVNKLFAGHGLKVWAIEVGNHLLNFILFGALYGLWR